MFRLVARSLRTLATLLFFLTLFKMGFLPKSWGQYPPEYNRAVHGFYDPSVYYGKRDTPFGEVKLKDLPAWLGRRKKTPSAVAGALSRAYWRHHQAWIGPKRPGIGGYLHYFMALSLVGYLLDYKKIHMHQQYRYH